MANKFLLFVVLFSACGHGDKQKVELNYNYKYVFVDNDFFFIERIKIFNSMGNTLYEIRLKSGSVGLNKVFLFHKHTQYTEQGSPEIVANDTLGHHIQVEIQSRDLQKIEIFEDRFVIDNQGIKIIEAIKEPFP